MFRAQMKQHTCYDTLLSWTLYSVYLLFTYVTCSECVIYQCH